MRNLQGSPGLLKLKLAAALGEKPALPGFKGALERLGAKSLIDGVTGAAAEPLGIAMNPVAQDAAAVEAAAQESPAAAAAKLEELLNAPSPTRSAVGWETSPTPPPTTRR